jgi:methylmalonyl-CoA mutase N-terminal domain/subunit
VARLRETRARRDAAAVERLLDRLAEQARDPSCNLIPVTIELVKASASLGEIVQRLRTVFGAYVEAPVF